MPHAHGEPVQPNSLDEAIAHVEAGGSLYIATYTRLTIITKKTLIKFRQVGGYLLREEGSGYRMQTGNSSVYLMPGQLKYN